MKLGNGFSLRAVSPNDDPSTTRSVVSYDEHLEPSARVAVTSSQPASAPTIKLVSNPQKVSVPSKAEPSDLQTKIILKPKPSIQPQPTPPEPITALPPVKISLTLPTTMTTRGKKPAVAAAAASTSIVKVEEFVDNEYVTNPERLLEIFRRLFPAVITQTLVNIVWKRAEESKNAITAASFENFQNVWKDHVPADIDKGIPLLKEKVKGAYWAIYLRQYLLDNKYPKITERDVQEGRCPYLKELGVKPNEYILGYIRGVNALLGLGVPAVRNKASFMLACGWLEGSGATYISAGTVNAATRLRSELYHAVTGIEKVAKPRQNHEKEQSDHQLSIFDDVISAGQSTPHKPLMQPCDDDDSSDDDSMGIMSSSVKASGEKRPRDTTGDSSIKSPKKSNVTISSSSASFPVFGALSEADIPSPVMPETAALNVDPTLITSRVLDTSFVSGGLIIDPSHLNVNIPNAAVSSNDMEISTSELVQRLLAIQASVARCIELSGNSRGHSATLNFFAASIQQTCDNFEAALREQNK